MFSPIKITKVYEQIVQQIEDMVTDGVLNKGDKLPSEKELAEKFKVSRFSVREALVALKNIGIVERIQGVGDFIK